MVIKCPIHVSPKPMVCAAMFGAGGVSGAWGHLALAFTFPSGMSVAGVGPLPPSVSGNVEWTTW